MALEYSQSRPEWRLSSENLGEQCSASSRSSTRSLPSLSWNLRLKCLSFKSQISIACCLMFVVRRSRSAFILSYLSLTSLSCPLRYSMKGLHLLHCDWSLMERSSSFIVPLLVKPTELGVKVVIWMENTRKRAKCSVDLLLGLFGLLIQDLECTGDVWDLKQHLVEQVLAVRGFR